MAESGNGDEKYTLEVEGRSIECDTLADAIILRIAEHVAIADDIRFDIPMRKLIIKTVRKYELDALSTLLEKRIGKLDSVQPPLAVSR